jgi:hypothetical protein
LVAFHAAVNDVVLKVTHAVYRQPNVRTEYPIAASCPGRGQGAC